ncbi:MAG: aminoacyl-tRNA hydrolase [Patescibacteria group bacterium]
MKLIIGLGNPGKEYAHTRHNVGWDAVTAFAEQAQAPAFQPNKDFRAEITDAVVNETKVLFACPLTFMNLSGEAVQKIAHYYHIEPKDILVVHDEMDYELGIFAFMKKGGSAGHNGVSSVQEMMATDEIARLRIGIGRPLPPMKKEDFVLQHFSKEEQAIVDHTLERTRFAMTAWLDNGIDHAMNEWNGH